MAAMLGRLQRTTRVDVGLSVAFAGMAYLVWALVAGTSRHLVQDMIRSTAGQSLPQITTDVKVFFVDVGFLIDLVGLAWMVVSLLLIVFASRQKLSISWAWVSAVCQAGVAALGAVLVGQAVLAPHTAPSSTPEPTALEQVSGMSLWVILAVAILIWVTFLVWLLVERARFDRRRGPTLRDGLRTNVFR